jgi:hypothetical protein
MARTRLPPAGCAAALLLSACRASVGPEPAPVAPPTVEEARAFYAAQPRHLRPLPAAGPIEGLPDVRAETCALCHRAIYEEWRISTHARAWLDDAQFQEELAKSRTAGGKDVGWMCINCHTPVENQLPKLVARLEGGDLGRPVYVDNPGYDAAFEREAISCATCHVQGGTILGPRGDSVAPHPVAKDPSLRTVEVCTQCHQARAHFPDLNLACMFDTGAEHAKSPAAAEGRICQSCHMPEVEREVATNGPVRRTRRHWFGGSLIPKHPDFTAELAPLAEHFPPGMAVRWPALPERLDAGRTATITWSLVNAEAGHMLPTGDPERFITVEAVALGPDGAELGRSATRIGSEYRWHPTIELVRDTRLTPGEARPFALSFRVPAAGPVRLRIEASRWRISEENLRYHHLEGRMVPGQRFHASEQTLGVGPTTAPGRPRAAPGP